jgi:DNA-binding response OmpR family regulator
MISQKTILVIEDDKSISNSLQKKLSESNVRTLIAANGNEGLTMAKTKPDLIMLNVMLPGGLNGFDILSFLKRDSATKDIPVVVTTKLENEQKTAIELGASGFILKTKMSIEETVSKLLSILNK